VPEKEEAERRQEAVINHSRTGGGSPEVAC
jgi:hypothetical protein